MKHLAILSLFPFLAAPAMAAPARLDPERTVGPQECAKCHDLEHKKWQETAHAKLYESEQPLHQRPRAQQIAKHLGKTLIKNDPLCQSCHFTPRPLSSKVTAQAGVSCEHCHGAARDWIHEHNTFEGRQVDRRSETPEQRRQRWERNARLGMRSPGQLYDLLSSCYRCHLVPDETLVNLGGHVNGGEFDLPARFEAIRHNFVRGQRKENAATPPERNRQLYVLGLALELEHGLRGLAEAQQEGGDYAAALAERIEEVRRRLRKAAQKAPLQRLDSALAAADGLRLAAGNAAELGAAIQKVSAAARGFAEQEDGSRLAALDPLFQEAEQPPPEETAEIAAEDTEAEEAVGDAAGPPAGAGPAPSPGGGGSTRQAASPSARMSSAGGQGLPGKPRDRLRTPRPAGKVVGPRSCQASCHGEPNQKWRRDKHYRTADPFQDGNEGALRIANRYYGQPVELDAGGIACMDCHGTVKDGEIEAGVSCESCHGPAGAFFKPHQNHSLSRPARLQLGILDLENAAKRAEVCTSCHYITDARLLASGHPRPEPFDLWERSERIKHWQGGPDAGALRAAFQEVISKRGTVPQVPAARLEEAVAQTAGGVPPIGAVPARTAAFDSLQARLRAANGQPPPPRPLVPASSAAAPPSAASARPVHFELPPLPAGLDQRPVAEILRRVQRRLEMLYAQAGGGA